MHVLNDEAVDRQWQFVGAYAQYLYVTECMFKQACESLLLPECLMCLCIWECGFALGSHICPNQNNVSQIKIWSTDPVTLFPSSQSHLPPLQELFNSFTAPPLLHSLSLCLDTFFSLGLVGGGPTRMWEISPPLAEPRGWGGQWYSLLWGPFITQAIRYVFSGSHVSL